MKYTKLRRKRKGGIYENRNVLDGVRVPSTVPTRREKLKSEASSPTRTKGGRRSAEILGKQHT